MPDAAFRLNGDRMFSVRINGPDPTFRLASNAIRAAALSELDDRSLDFLEIAAAIFAADGSVKRGGPARSHMGAAWRRDFAFRSPVRRPDLWSRPEILEALIEATEFLTEDHVAFEFVQAQQHHPAEPYLRFEADGASFSADEVILFSGGLDSFAGALETLSNTDKRVVLVTHRSAPKTTTRQVELGRYLQSSFEGRVLHLHVTARRAGTEAQDANQRSRTLLFTAMGQAVAQALGAEHLSFYENGIVSHNLPLSQQIVGTMATRTTHPLALTRLNDLIRLLWPEGARIENRYQWLTKTEVLRRIGEAGAAELIPKAVSCTSVRDQTKRFTHCGACSQCLDRRFAILAAGLERFDKPEDYRTEVLSGPRESTRSRTMANEWTRHALRLGQLDETSAMTEFGLEISRILRGHMELSPSEVLRRTLALHHRHAEAVREVLERTIANLAADIAAHALPSTSLLIMHVGQTVPGRAPEEDGLLRFVPLPDETEPGPMASEVPDGGLEIAFFKEGDRYVIVARDLGRVMGAPAMVAHGLKPAFDEDRAAGRAPEDHRYFDSRDVPICKSMTKDTFRKHVHSCRKQLEENFLLLHGSPPTSDLLIQSAQGQGYRLDPRTLPIDAKGLEPGS